MKKKMALIVVALMVCFSLALIAEGTAQAQGTQNNLIIPAKDQSGQSIGQIDWTKQEILAQGNGAPPANTTEAQGRLMACRAAEVEARRNLLEVIKGVQIDSDTQVVNYVTQSDVIRTKIQGIVQATTTEKQNLPDGTCSVTVRLGIHEVKPSQPSLAAAVLPQYTATPAPQATPAPTPKGTVQEEITKTDPGGPTYTGLVIDARGLGARPAMSPKVLDESGDPLYGSAYVSRDYAVEHGMAGYTKNLEAASRNARVTDNPLVAKAVSASGNGKTDLVLSNQDAARLKVAGKSQSFLAQAKIMIVLD